MVALPTSSYLLWLNTVTCTLAKVVLRRARHVSLATVTSDSDSRPLRNLSLASSELWHLRRLAASLVIA